MKKLLRFFLIFLLLVAFSETLLRYIYRPYILNPQNGPDTIEWMQQYGSLNNAGYRGRDYSLTKPENAFRIYTIGDSYTFGWYINNLQDTFPAIIEKELQKKSEKRIEVINAAFWGFNIYEEVNRFLWEGKQYHPDIVLFGLNHFEANLPDINYIRRDHFLPQILLSSSLYDFLIGKYFRVETDRRNYELQRSVFSQKNSPSWNTFVQQILILKQGVEKSGAKLAVLLFPYIHPLNANIPYDFYAFHKKMRQFGKENSIIIIDPLDDFLAYKDKNELSLTPVDPHPSVKMNHMVAESFVKQFPLNLYIDTPEKESVTETVNLNKANMSLGDFLYIHNSSSSASSLPFVYFEEKYGDFQELPVQKLSSQKFILPNKLITKPGEFSPQLRYYASPQKKGAVIIPKTAYGYPVVGFKQFYGVTKIQTYTIQFNPLLIKEDKNNYIITYDPKYDFSVVKTILYVQANQIDIDPAGKVSAVKKIIVINTITPVQTDKISVPFHGNIIATPRIDTLIQLKTFALQFPIILQTLKRFNFLSSSNKLSPLAQKFILPGYNTPSVFVNGVYTKTTGIEYEKDILTIHFDKPLKKGTHITIALQCAWRLENEETIDVTVEKEK